MNQNADTRKPTGSTTAAQRATRPSRPTNRTRAATVATTGNHVWASHSVPRVTATTPAPIQRPTVEASHHGTRSSRRVMSRTTVARPAKMAGIRWHRITRPNRSAPSALSWRVRMPLSRTARYSTARVSEMEKANSPAMVDGMLPPRMVKPVSYRNAAAPTAMSGGPGKGRRAARPSAYPASGMVTRPATVTTLNAMLYGTGTHRTARTPATIHTSVRSTEEVIRFCRYHVPAATAASRNGVSHNGGPTFNRTITSDGMTM